MWQAEHVAGLLKESHPDLEVVIVPMKTLGDKDRRTPLPGMGQIGVFTKEIEEALLDDRCDAAVHSMKDLPTRLAPGLSLGAVLKRADPRDALVGRDGKRLDQIPEGSAVGTSSLRRRAQVLHMRPDLEVRDLRGNVPTRLRAVGIVMEEESPASAEERPAPPAGGLQAVFLAYAGLERLGAASHVTEVFDADRMLPAPGQGAIAVEIRGDDAWLAECLIPLDDGPTRFTTAAETEFLEALGGWCHIPVGALGRLDGSEVILDGLVGDPDGKRIIRDSISGSDPRRVGRRLADLLRERGAGEILEEVLKDNPSSSNR
jgi:hydroxymethylbilane synthase